MYVFELLQPGTRLEGIADQDENRETEVLIGLLIDCVADAAVALALFESAAGQASPSGADRRARRDQDRQRERAISDRLEAALPANLSPEERFRAYDSIREQAGIEAKREAWSAGTVPDSYSHRVVFVHAKSVVYALDTLQKGLALLSKLLSAPREVGAALSDFERAFPNLKHIRDSAHHIEDRVRGKKRERPMHLKPIMNGIVHAPNGGALIVSSLMNNRYGGTLADGTYGEVEVSANSVAIAQQVVQRVLDAYVWRGPSNHMPR